MELKHNIALQKSVLFGGIKDEECKKLLNCLSPHTRQFAKNEILLLTGEAVRHIGIILSGTASAYLEHINGSQTIISALTPHSTFGEVLVSTRTHKSPVTVYATSDIAVAFIEYERLFSYCKEACTAHKTFLENMLKIIGDKYFLLFDRINILREKSLRARIMAYLYTLYDKKEAAVVTIPFTKTMLADYLLANRSALSKELRKMENEGLIRVKGRDVEIISP